MPLSPAASRWPVAVTTELRPKPGSYLLDIRHTRQKRKRRKKKAGPSFVHKEVATVDEDEGITILCLPTALDG